MKNSKLYAGKISKLYRSLKRSNAKVAKVEYEDPTSALIYAILSEDMTATAADSAMRKLSRHFVDWNDLRVSRIEEMLDVIGQDNSKTQELATKLSVALQYIFDKYNTVSLSLLAETGKRQAKQAIQSIEGASSFTVNYVMLTSLSGHAMPLTKTMITYLRENQLVYPTADENDIEGFLERQIPASRGYEFYALLRRASEKPARKTKKAAKTSKKTKKVVKPKTKTRKKTKTKKVTKKKK